MKMLLFIISAFIILICNNAIAEYTLYNIENVFSVPFPSKPVFFGDVGHGKSKHRNYQYFDEVNGVGYSATYQVNADKFSDSVIYKALDNYVTGYVNAAGAKLISSNKMQFKDGRAVTFVSTQETNGSIVYKYSIAVYRKNRFYLWSVMSANGISKIDAKDIFRSNYNYITFN